MESLHNLLYTGALFPEMKELQKGSFSPDLTPDMPL